MSIEIRVLAQGRMDAAEKTLYSPANPQPPSNDPKKAAIVKSMRFANVVGTQTITLNVYFIKSGGNVADPGQQRLLLPYNLQLAAGAAFVDSTELTLSPGDTIRINQDPPPAGSAVDFQISGIERDYVP